jgi:hypothetical protein
VLAPTGGTSPPGRRVTAGSRATANGFEILERDDRERCPVPFNDHVVLAQTGDEGGLRVPCFDDNTLPMAIGVKLDQEKLKPDTVQRVTLVHRTAVPRFGSGKQSRCYELKAVVAAGFTLEFHIHRSEVLNR